MPRKSAEKENRIPEAPEDLADNLEEGVEHLTPETLDRLTHDELLQILDILPEESEAFDRVKEFFDSKQKPSIETATIGHRIWSYFYDKMILRIILIIWLALGFFVFSEIWPEEQMISAQQKISRGMLMTLAVLPVIVISWRLFIAFRESARSSTPGSTPARRHLGLRVVDRSGRPLSLTRSFLRGIFRWVPLSFITLFSIERSAEKRGMHDRLFGSYVLRINRSDVNQADISAFIRDNFNRNN